MAVAQWALLLGLGLLVILMYRQLGRIFSGQDHVEALGPAVGSAAGEFQYTRLSDGSLQRFVPGGGHGALVAFVDPTCPSCEELVSAMSARDDAGEFADLRVLLVTFDPPVYVQVSDAFRSTQLEIAAPTSDNTRAAYNASATPLLVAVGSDGAVREAGPITDLKQVPAFVDAALSSAAARDEAAALPVITTRRSTVGAPPSATTATAHDGGITP